jgi:hypothetical protein
LYFCDPEIFEEVRVNHESGTVEWPGEVDIDPEVLYGRYEPASGHSIERRTVREPLKAGGQRARFGGVALRRGR